MANDINEKKIKKIKKPSIRIRVEGHALVRLNILSKQFRLSRTQLIALLVEEISEQDIANAMLHQMDDKKSDTNREDGF